MSASPIKHERRVESAREFQEFVQKCKHTGIAEVLTNEAILLAWFLKGNEMWRKETA